MNDLIQGNKTLSQFVPCFALLGIARAETIMLFHEGNDGVWYPLHQPQNLGLKDKGEHKVDCERVVYHWNA